MPFGIYKYGNQDITAHEYTAEHNKIISIILQHCIPNHLMDIPHRKELSYINNNNNNKINIIPHITII